MYSLECLEYISGKEKDKNPALFSWERETINNKYNKYVYGIVC